MIKAPYAAILLFPCVALAAPIECGPYQDPAAFARTVTFPYIPVVQTPQIKPTFAPPPGSTTNQQTQFPTPPGVKR